MKQSQRFFLIGAALLFFWIIGGFNPYLSWEHRLLKIVMVTLFAGIAWIIKNSEKVNRRQVGLIIVLLLAAGAAYAEPYASDLIFGYHHHHFFCFK
jgi:hypothetical protein